jgi:hypothetical protein
MRLLAVMVTGSLALGVGCSRDDGKGLRVESAPAAPRPDRNARDRTESAESSESPVPTSSPTPPKTGSELDQFLQDVERLGGATDRDKTRAGRPVVAVSLTGTRAVDADLARLRHLPDLRELDLSFTRVTDEGLIHLESLKELVRLDLSGTRVTDAGLPRLQKFPALTTLDLYRTRVTDAGLEPLRALQSLRLLVVRGTAVTEEAAKRFHELRPEVQVDR